MGSFDQIMAEAVSQGARWRPSRPVRLTTLLLAVVLATSACASGQGRQIGTAVGAQTGAIAGAVIGSQVGGSTGWRILGTIVGLAAGAIAGSVIGTILDREDREAADDAYDEAYFAPAGEAVEWENEESGNSGEVRAEGTSFMRDGRPCRTFEHSYVADGEVHSDEGVACQEPDGSWRLY